MSALTSNFQQAVSVLMPDYMRGAIDTANDPILKAFPFGYVDSAKVLYDQWETNFGLINLRGLGAKPDVRAFNGWKRYIADPAYFGDTTLLEEGEITQGVQPGTLGDALNIGDRLGLFMTDMSALILNRARKSAADLIATGRMDIQDSAGRRFQYALENYSSQIKLPATGWYTSAATATPIQDMLGFQADLQKGTDSEFGADSFLLATSQTIKEFFSITQIIGTYKTDYGATVNGLDKYNKEIAGTTNQGFTLPKIVRYDKGYYPTAADAIAKTNWSYFVPTRTFLWFGSRPAGQQVAQWQLTRHAGLVEDNAGSYPEVSGVGGDKAEIGKGLYVRCHYQNKQPHHYELEAGVNGLPVVLFPSAFASIVYT